MNQPQPSSGYARRESREELQEQKDSALVESFLAGDTRAFSEIVERHRAQLTHVARRYTHNDTDAHDIVQEALLKASTSMGTYRQEAKLSTWLHRLVMNTGFDFLNHRSNRENASLDHEDFNLDTNMAIAHDPTDAMEDLILVKEIARKLNKDQVEALYLTDVMGWSMREVAEKQGVQPGTIKSRRARAREILRDAVSGDDNRQHYLREPLKKFTAL